jgi:hypothetical protein
MEHENERDYSTSTVQAFEVYEDLVSYLPEDIRQASLCQKMMKASGLYKKVPEEERLNIEDDDYLQKVDLPDGNIVQTNLLRLKFDYEDQFAAGTGDSRFPLMTNCVTMESFVRNCNQCGALDDGDFEWISRKLEQIKESWGSARDRFYIAVDNILDGLQAPDPETIEKAKEYIREYVKDEFGEDSEPDFTDLENVPLAYTTVPDKEIPVQVNIDLIHMQIKTYIGEDAKEPEGVVMVDLEGLQYMDFDSLIADVQFYEEPEIGE